VISLAEVIVPKNEKVGFEQVRQKGSHKFFRHSDGRTATVPDHKGEDLGRGITNKILKLQGEIFLSGIRSDDFLLINELFRLTRSLRLISFAQMLGTSQSPETSSCLVLFEKCMN
jgi:predicted RNA binding protein YcfA (HicA-like mRNA interferase family)